LSALLGILHGWALIEKSSWGVLIYLGIFGCGLLWILWSIGLRQASASAVALTVTVNALTASLLGALFLSEPIGPELVVGLAAVALGIALAVPYKGGDRLRAP
jgi:drug/metabolite transporter (DMT)-like permease